MTDALDSVIEALAGGESPGAILHVVSDKNAFCEARGLYAKGRSRTLSPSDGFRIASMSKTFTGTLAMQDVEAGRLSLDAPLGEFLDVSNMPMADGHDRNEVTIRHLLNHTSGLWDFAMSRDWARRIWSDPSKFFDPAQTLAWAFANGEPVGAPGDGYHYSDTGYVALGLVLEKVNGLSWGDLCRRRIFAPLNMNETWLEGYESPRSSLSHTYFRDQDGLAIHGSVDWAAGGHVSTATDLAVFLRGLMAGDLFAHEETLKQMCEGAKTELGYYGAGLAVRPFDDVVGYGHSGFWGSFMFCVPTHNLTVTGTVNQTESDRADALAEAIRIGVALAG